VSDYEPPDAWWKSSPRARKQHRCCECGAEICPGDIYENARGVWSGEFRVFKTCDSCARLRSWFYEQGSDIIPYGGLREEFNQSEEEIPAMIVLAISDSLLLQSSQRSKFQRPDPIGSSSSRMR